MSAEMIEYATRWVLTELGEAVLDDEEDRFELTAAGVAALDG
jgi:hypothetical protein